MPIVAVIKELVIEKRAELSDVQGLNIDLSFSQNSVDKCVRLNLMELKRHFSNLIKNAVEATEGRDLREIRVAINTIGSNIEICISDSGVGIPTEIANSVGIKGFTFGKENGSGLGIYFAKESIKQWGGELRVANAEPFGAKISITLPICQAPDWFTASVSPTSGQKVVIVDDDSSMFARWKDRLSDFGGDFACFKSATEFRHWFAAGGQFEDSLVFLFDYNLDSQNNGIDLINGFGICKESVLVTSGYKDEAIQAAAIATGVKIVPKVLI